ncbi:hypothetical protein [Salipiger mucosus]|uniref:Uncharacterized protein n=1 Tax=Salipiger mucosus DSM 16094 TaxID=1123237 RepID=S9RJ48_9RHOB|nr:hypothetical protein [Salipiger mucosus]EPX78120.1 hypothetical protein Salmuc_04467 [Salipiger mucosus DSM 16094]
MMQDRADVLVRAHEIGRGLTDAQRIALGVTLIGTARQPESFGAARAAERMVGEHARMLLADALRGDEAMHQTKTVATTHGNAGNRLPGGRGTVGAPRPAPFLSSLRAAWATIRAAERRLSESLLGDLLGGVSVVALVVGTIIGLGVLL